MRFRKERFHLSRIEQMEKIADQIRRCVRCPLWKGRKKAVPGAGSVGSAVMLVGEAPGYWEDVKGLPFVGAAGKVLDGLLEWIGLRRETVFITNVVKCRPPGNRVPHQLEIKTCTSLYLDRQIGLIKPKVIVTLGRHSTAYVLCKAGFDEIVSISDFRGKVYDVKLERLRLAVVPMYHPASVLHDPKYREELEKDFQLLKKELKKKHIAY